MIGKLVRYKTGKDKKEYIIVDYSQAVGLFEAEICILVDFPYFSGKTKQLMIWQPLSRFEIMEDE